MTSVGEIKVKWGMEAGRDSRVFPKETLLTEDNSEAVLRTMSYGVGRDVLDVKLDTKPAPKQDGKGAGAAKKTGTSAPKKLSESSGPKKLAVGTAKKAGDAAKK